MTSRVRKARRQGKTHGALFVVLSILLGLVVVCGAGVVGMIKLCDSWLTDLPDYTDASAYVVAVPSKVYSADGVLLAEFASENRDPTTIDQVSSYVLEGTVDTEDIRFYSHNGIDIQGIGRAVIAQLEGNSEGASTITQQLVRNTLLLDEMTDLTLKRKVREAYLALQVEKIYSKDDILTMYLNTINYGDGAYGIEAAAEHYFSKSAADLTLAEAATLIGIPQSPTSLNPVYYPNATKARRNVVLARMLSAGDITQEEYDEAVAEPLTLNLSTTTSNGVYFAPYFVAYVKTLLEENFTDTQILEGGLTVYTTLDTSDQTAAEQACTDGLEDQKSGLEYSLTSIDPSNGHIVAMVGGQDYSTSQFNLATQMSRQAGSSFKTFTLIAALQAGVSPNTYINANSPAVIGTWTVNNMEGEASGDVTLKYATWTSINTVYARLIDAIGASSVVSTAHAMGITSDLVSYDSITLGTSGVNTLEMASAYATIAAGGVYRAPVAITSVVDSSGTVLYQNQTTDVQAITPEVAYAATQVLEGVITEGTSTSAKLSSGQIAAGKSGTSEENRDNWFVGYTPQLSTAVWLGYSTETTIYYDGVYGYGGTTCGPVWKQYMTAALANDAIEPFTTAAAPTYDTSTWSTALRGTTSASTASSLVGLTKAAALAQLTSYTVTVTEEYSSTVASGVVISASIDSSSETARISVSVGPSSSSTSANTASSTNANTETSNSNSNTETNNNTNP
jgi:1A family penicillin-binding protein